MQRPKEDIGWILLQRRFHSWDITIELTFPKFKCLSIISFASSCDWLILQYCNNWYLFYSFFPQQRYGCWRFVRRVVAFCGSSNFLLWRISICLWPHFLLLSQCAFFFAMFFFKEHSEPGLDLWLQDHLDRFSVAITQIMSSIWEAKAYNKIHFFPLVTSSITVSILKNVVLLCSYTEL